VRSGGCTFFEIADHGADIMFSGENAEVIHPEPGHLFL
jgi:hypothetical protein